jgi:WD repeat-containing protein 21A
MAGKIKLWDLKATKHIRQYKGLMKESTYLFLQMHKKGGVLVELGYDCYTKIWPLQCPSAQKHTSPKPHFQC